MRRFLRRVLAEVPAALEQASLFGSKARGEARPDSDLDVLLVFRELPPDREPQASQAEAIAAEVAAASGVPVTVWSVSLVDLERGHRTPMLVDALDDSLPLWWARRPLRPIRFTPEDGVWCAGRLLLRVAEGSDEFAQLLADGAGEAAARRARDDLVRLCTALLLLRGITRPRRAEAVRCLPSLGAPGVRLPPAARAVLAWAADSYGPDGRDDDRPLPPPPGGAAAAARSVDLLRSLVERRVRALEAALRRPPLPPRSVRHRRPAERAWRPRHAAWHSESAVEELA